MLDHQSFSPTFACKTVASNIRGLSIFMNIKVDISVKIRYFSDDKESVVLSPSTSCGGCGPIDVV